MPRTDQYDSWLCTPLSPSGWRRVQELTCARSCARGILLFGRSPTVKKNIAKIAVDSAYPIIPCNLFGSQENLQITKAKSMIAEWDLASPWFEGNAFHSLQNITPSQMTNRSLFNYLDFYIDRSEARLLYKYQCTENSSSRVEN